MDVLVQYSIFNFNFFTAVCGGKFDTILFHQKKTNTVWFPLQNREKLEKLTREQAIK
jgi:hypothetical protein